MTFVRTPPPKAPAASPMPAIEADSGSATVNDEALDELTALFLSPASPPRENAAPARTQPAITELLLPGHLPVRGNLWLTPYADAVAQREGCCTLLRMDDADEFSLQVLRGSDPRAAASRGAVREVIESFIQQTQVWMIRPVSPLNHRELVQCGADRITILTGTDGISVVAAYQLIKDLAAAAAEADVPMPQLALAVVGVEQAAAEEMVRRINVTAASFLKRDIELRLCLPRIDATAPCTQHLSFSGEPCPSVGNVVSWINTAEHDFQAAAAAPAHTPVQSPYQSTREPQREDDASFAPQRRNGHGHAPAAKIAAAPVKLAGLSSDCGCESASTQPVEPSEPAPAPAAPAEPTESLTQHIAGLQPLALRCPHHSSIELAVGDAGSLHLIAQAEDLRELHSVKAWAMAHHELLAMACSELSIGPDVQPVCHVVTDAPASVADLHKTGLKLHVLARVAVKGETAWYAAPLN